MDEKIECRTPTPGKETTRIEKWKFEAVRRAILQVVSSSTEGVAWAELPELVGLHLKASERNKLGSINWYTTTVEQELEARGEIEQVPDRKTQYIRRV